MNEPKRTKTQARNHAEMMRELLDIEAGIRERHLKKTLVPEGWTEISTSTPSRKRAKMTLRVDEDVHRWFRAQGPGYQARVNQVLRVHAGCDLKRTGRGL